ncbi:MULTISPECIES: hypothetical protein [unclassified Spirosoma]|uniref:hypothetical protein n=1 Tax=unclassified Spirosoma TaxID=2621999 RepID=UPI0009652339|nr:MULTISPECIES: hypothetical protein [unclassified Spirosoma]MBN8824347.1 hypothetical protein [Spirosoma sp.]OJW70187.1 MAG: hypothetical protein BGO59_26310 [Spirosoma sp. 48-14]
MLKLILSTCFFISLSVQAAFCQNLEPLELAKRIFDKSDFPKLPNYMSGEYEGHPNGSDLPKNSVTRFQVLDQTNQQAVVALTILDAGGQGVDNYLFFRKESVWKLYAVRALAMNGFNFYLKKMLERLTPRQIDSVVTSSKKNPKASLFSSKKEYAFKLGNARLMTSTDDQLIHYFKAHKAEFEKLKQLMLNRNNYVDADKESKRRFGENLKSASEKLFLSYSPTGDDNFIDATELVIGGMVDNWVGYVHIPDKKDVPVMSAGHIILLREIGNGWYLYKTT